MNNSNTAKLQAGDFALWLEKIEQIGNYFQGMEVPCGSCRACCTSSLFIQIKPDEKEALLKIPDELLFPAPGLPEGNVLLGFDEHGHCPMFVDNECSIYEHRPQTCRDFDCRIFPATGISESAERPLIVEQSNRWQFEFSDQNDRETINALRDTAHFLMDYSNYFPENFVPQNSTQLAALAIKLYKAFLGETDIFFESLTGNQIKAMVKKILNIYNSSKEGSK